MKKIIAIFFITMGLTHAAYNAIISSPRAIIYSDDKLSSPLGFVRKGKRVLVGEVTRKRGRVFTTVLSGKIVYIKSKDISLIDAPEFAKLNQVSEHHVDFNPEENEILDPLDENNHLILWVSAINPGSQWESLSLELGESSKDMIAIGPMIEHRHPLKNWIWDIGLKYYSIGQEAIKLQFVTIEGHLKYRFFNTRKVHGVISAGLLGSGDSRITTSFGNIRTESALYGYDYGVGLTFFPKGTFGIQVGYAVKNLTFANMTFPINSTEYRTLTKIGGGELYGVLSYSF